MGSAHFYSAPVGFMGRGNVAQRMYALVQCPPICLSK